MILSAFLREFKLFSRKNTRFGLREDAEAFAVSKQIRCDASCIFLILSDKMRSLIGRTTTGEVVAGVAQLVEQRIRNAKVGGSIPLTGTIKSSISALLQTFPSFLGTHLGTQEMSLPRFFIQKLKKGFNVNPMRNIDGVAGVMVQP